MDTEDSESLFRRDTPARSSVARKCREFYLQRLERTNNMQKRWSVCEPSASDITVANDSMSDSRVPTLTSSECQLAEESSTDPSLDKTEQQNNSSEDNFPLRKCRSTLDLAMDSLRKEISSLIQQDNDLFRQLLSLHDSIAELRERQRSCYNLYPDDDDNDESLCKDEDGGEDGDREDDSNSPSLESLSDNGDLPETSPDSTLSCRSSSLSSDSVKYHHKSRHANYALNRNRHRVDAAKKRYRAATTSSNEEPRPLIFVDKSRSVCFRCRKMAPPLRTSRYGSYWSNHEEMDSYDSGIHLQGSHSDSDHEIFV